ncbi:MAG: TetR/AcrR family transcriptional regulator [Clostridia bacterium]|nr:TetR/AcrR family transcriptional regulator [Clostridia bacterium]
MDRRQKKTRDAIFKAFGHLLEGKKYEHITVQEIIDEADIGRSTFYAHFETKDTLLKEMCSDIFDHIFSDKICEYSAEKNDLETKLAHILWHLQNNNFNIYGLLSSQSGDLFLQYLKEQLAILFKMYLSDFHTDTPEDFLLYHLIGSFAEAIKWWVNNKMQHSPEQIAKYFMAVTETH